jgi:hypothetical protein
MNMYEHSDTASTQGGTEPMRALDEEYEAEAATLERVAPSKVRP